MPKKPTTLLEHASKYVKKYFEQVKPLHVDAVTISPTSNPLVFEVRISGHLKYQTQKTSWSVLFTIQNDRLIDIVYIAPRFEVLSPVDFSLTSGRARGTAVDAFHANKARIAGKRHNDSARNFQRVYRLCNDHSQRVHAAIEAMSNAVAPK